MLSEEQVLLNNLGPKYQFFKMPRHKGKKGTANGTHTCISLPDVNEQYIQSRNGLTVNTLLEAEEPCSHSYGSPTMPGSGLPCCGLLFFQLDKIHGKGKKLARKMSPPQ